jgi:hypothetical protein
MLIFWMMAAAETSSIYFRALAALSVATRTPTMASAAPKLSTSQLVAAFKSALNFKTKESGRERERERKRRSKLS